MPLSMSPRLSYVQKIFVNLTGEQHYGGIESSCFT
jgi:hypothetical protein